MTRMTFNGIDMSRFFRITDIVRPVGNTRDVETKESPFIGINVQQVKIGAKIIKVKFVLQGQNLESLKHELAGVLNVTEPARLTFSDEPDKYYLAIPDGDIGPDNLARWFQRSEITFLIPDGVAHSTTYRVFDGAAAKLSGDRVIFTLDNKGTVPAFPIIEVQHNTENGYLGFVNKEAAFELGSREEVDVETYRRSEVLLDFANNNRITQALGAGLPNVAILNDRLQTLDGTLGIEQNWGRPHVALINRGGTSGNHAGSITWDIPMDSSREAGSLNEYIWWRQIFWLGAANQLGFIKIAFSDDRGNFLYGVETIKRANGLGVEYNFLASDGRGGYRLVKQWTFTGTHWDYHNPFNEPRGWSDLLRRDDMVQVYWWGSYPQFHIPEIKGKKTAKMSVALGTFGNHPLVSHMYLDQIFYRKDFVTGMRDVPNRFSVGSKVVVNSEEDTVMVDNMHRLQDVVHGSRWLSIPPGKSELEVYTSSWCNQRPRVTIKFEERWL